MKPTLIAKQGSRSSWSCTGLPCTPMLLKVIDSGKLDAKRLATHRFKLSEVMKAYDTFGDAAKERALKVILQNA